MKNIKIIALYSIFIVSAFINNNVYAAVGTGMGADTGYLFGVKALEIIGDGIGSTVGAVKAGAVYVAPAMPYIAGAAVVVVCGYGTYRVYRCYYPTPEQLAALAKIKAETAKSEAEEAKSQEEQKLSALEFQEKHEVLKTKASLRVCLRDNHNFEKDKNGVPRACEEQLRTFALYAGYADAEDIVKTFKQYASHK